MDMLLIVMLELLHFPLQEFESTILNIICGFEQAAASFKSLVKDPQLAIYVTPPASDTVYLMSRDEEQEAKAKKQPWPVTSLLFGKDERYQSDVKNIVLQIREEAERVVAFSKVCELIFGNFEGQLRIG